MSLYTGEFLFLLLLDVRYLFCVSYGAQACRGERLKDCNFLWLELFTQMR